LELQNKNTINLQRLTIVKIGGNVIDDEMGLQAFLYDFTQIIGHKILIHGGGKIATRMAEDLGIKQTMVDGRRITDKDTLNIVTMTYAGLINKTVVSRLQSFGCNAIGLSGADGNLIQSIKRGAGTIDYGFAGDVKLINTALVQGLLELGLSPVVCPITHDKQGLLLNTNADTIAQELATAMASQYEVSLIYSFEKKGVLLDVHDESSVILSLQKDRYKSLVEENKIFEGMIPKLDNAFAAIDKGVKKVIIGKAADLKELIEGKTGTSLI
jgi:acetylglutamate kinase